MSLTPLLALALGCAHLPRDPAPERGMVGIRYETLPEGLLVTAVLPGTGAEAAGLGVGDLIVRVDGLELGPESAAVARALLPGPAGASVALELVGPLRGERRAVEVRRRPAGADREEPEEEELRRLRRAVGRGTPAQAERAATALVAADFLGGNPGPTAARVLRAEGRARPSSAAAAARALAEARPEDVDLQFLAAEALYRAGAYAEAAERLRRVEATRPPDLGGAEGWRGDAGGDPWGRAMLARALHALGEREEAAAVALALARTQDTGSLLAELGLPPLEAGEPWRARLEPFEDFEVPLLDGSPWRLHAARGQPVLINFWASWCGPCMQELPELAALARARRGELAVLAVSVDDPADRAAVERTVKRLELDLPVAHAPELASRFAVGPIPSSRLLSREGAMLFVDEGWSPSSMARMAEQVDAAIATPPGSGSTLGSAWSAGEARLVAFLGLNGAGDVVADERGLLVGVDGRVPVRVQAGASGLLASLPHGAPPGASASARVAWLDGPVAAEAGRPWLRAWDAEGAPRWLLTTPAAVNDLAVHEGRLWVATEDELLALDAAGVVQARLPGGAEDLAPAEGGLWAVDGRTRRWIGAAGVEDRGAAPDGACALADGRVASRLAESCVLGRFGADGGARAVISREDGVVIGLDARGAPAFTLALQAGSRLAAWDPDGDGRDALVVALRGQGLAWIELALP